MQFYKMQATGNDYIYFNLLDGQASSLTQDYRELAIRLSHRHYGVGGDGVVLILPSKRANCLMRMFNADGSEGGMCGNAIRCVGKLLYENGYVTGDTLTVDTLSGVKTLVLDVQRGRVDSVRVDMGVPSFSPHDIPMLTGELSGGQERNVDDVLKKVKQNGELNGGTIVVGGEQYTASALSMGNPHLVVFVSEPEDVPLERVGYLFENYHLFPERVNTEFCCVRGGELFARVYERGSGETLACGTGACAVAVASYRLGLVGSTAVVHMRGGDLVVECQKNRVWLEGGAEFVFEGKIYF